MHFSIGSVSLTLFVFKGYSSTFFISRNLILVSYVIAIKY